MKATEAQTRIIGEHWRSRRPFNLFGVDYLIWDMEISTNNLWRRPHDVMTSLPPEEITVVIDAEALSN